MGHKSTVYNVRVRRKRDPDTYLPLGNIDGGGTWLLEVLKRYMQDLDVADADEERRVQSTSVKRSGVELYVSLLHGQTNLVSDIFGKAGTLNYRQVSDDTQKVRCACLLRLPPAEDMGFLATHNNNGRAIKGLLEKGIQAQFREQFPDLVLSIKPFIEGSVFQEALSAGRLLKLKLIRIDRAEDPAEQGLGKWVERGTAAKQEMTLTPRAKGAYLRTRLPLEAIRGSEQAFGQLLEFEDQTYDQARVEVVLQNGRTRMFTIGDPDAGYAISEDLQNLRFTPEGEPTDRSLQRSLEAVLDEAVRPRHRQ